MNEARGREAIPEIARMLKAIDVCVFATRGNGGQLHARPMSNNRQVEWDGDSWFFAPADGRLVAELEAEPMAVTAYRAEKGFGFISVSGRTSVEADPELKRRYWLEELERWFPNGPDDPNVALIRLTAEHVDWWGEEGDGSADLRETAARA
jgi:general stress protein 26